MYLLDTNTCIYLIKRQPPQVLQRFQRLAPSRVGISTITLSELDFGVEKSRRREQNQLALIQFLAPLEILPFDDLAAAAYGKIRNYLEQKGRVIGSMDMLIAAQALALRAVLITNNEKEFRRVPGLIMENWVR
jgi:tRNA(fMet)-specific endonuclease VapC